MSRSSAGCSNSAIRNNADAGISSKSSSTLATFSVGVAYGTYNHESTATIGHGAAVTAANIGVSAVTNLPNENTWVQSWTDWQNPSDIFSHINGNAGVVNNILTSYANATGSGASGLAVAGSVNYFSVTNNTTAWVATDAHLTQSGGGNPGWSTRQSNGDYLDWAAPVTVTATTLTQSIDIAGNFSVFSLTGTGTSGTGAGGSLNLVAFNNTTIAGIARGAVVSSDKWVAVSAYTRDLFFALAPTSGLSTGPVSLNGVVSYAYINDTTHASIDNFATISAPKVSVKATESVSMLSIAGAVTQSGANGVGLSNAIIVVKGDTKAYVGANAADHAGDPASAATSGYIHADDFSVYGVTTGRVTIASIAAAMSDPASEAKNFAGKIAGAVTTAAGFFNDPFVAVYGLIQTAKSAATTASSAAPPNFSIDISGSTSVASVALNTSSTVDGATIDRYTTTGTIPPRVNIDVEALNNTIINAGSGAASINFSANPLTTSVAVAGAVAIGLLANATTASINATTVSNAGDVTVRALGSGEETIIGIGLSVAASASANSSAGAVSVSVADVTDSVNAFISGSSITGVAAGTGRDVLIQSYQTTDIGIGGGALYVGLKGGVGAALTYTRINNPSTQRNASDAKLSSTSISQMDTLTISAADAARIVAGAMVAGAQLASAGTGFAGSIVINSITPTISASIANNDNNPIRLSGALVVNTSGARNASLDTKVRNDSTIVANDAPPTSSDSFDFTASSLITGGTNSGAAILAIAGQVSGGGTSFGASIVSNTISQSYLASIGKSDIDTGSGDVFVTSSDTTKILAIAIGVGVAGGPLGAAGSIVDNRVSDAVEAIVGVAGSTPANTVIKAGNVSIAAANNASVKGVAGSVVVSTSGVAVGLSSVYSNVGNSVTAAVDGGKIEASKSVVLSALSTADIQAIAVGAALSSGGSVSGSVATSIQSTSVTARVTQGGDVLADNNVGILASNTDTIHVIAGALGVSGSSAGLGASVVVNTISGTTKAYVAGSTTKVDARGLSQTDNLQVNTGQLANPINLGTSQAPTDATPDMTETTEVVHGLAIVATSHQGVVANAVSAGFSGGVGAGLTVVTNIMGGETRAYVDSASIDTRLTAPAGATAPQINLLASSYSYAGNFVIGTASSGGSAGGAGAVGIRMDRTTYADMVNAQVGSVAVQTDSTTSGGTTTITKTYVPTVGAVRVRAVAEQNASNIVVAGGEGGAVGVAASGIVTVYRADTQAYVWGGQVTGQSLAVTANSRNGLFAATGAGAIANTAAVGAGFNVISSENTTQAYVGKANVATLVNLTGALNIGAGSANTFNSYAIGAAVSTNLGAGVAGNANMITVSNTTVAGLYNTDVNKQPTAITTGDGGL